MVEVGIATCMLMIVWVVVDVWLVVGVRVVVDVVVDWVAMDLDVVVVQQGGRCWVLMMKMVSATGKMY